MKMNEEQQKTDVTKELQDIVTDFNIAFEDWQDKYGCVANFAFGYAGNKKIEISSIDKIIYRKPAPSFEKISELLPKGA